MAQSNETSAIKAGQNYSIEQWRTWPEGERWELIGGVTYDMRPSPGVSHQKIAGSLYCELSNYLEDNDCTPLIAPVDLFLPEAVEGSTHTVVQPDVMVVCNPSIIEENGVHGGPDLIIEVLSDSTAYKDLNAKKSAYERSGVKEYWIVNPGTGSVFIYLLDKGKYIPAMEVLAGNIIESAVIAGFKLTLNTESL